MSRDWIELRGTLKNMVSSENPINCPTCGVRIPKDSVDSICPRCLLQQAAMDSVAGHYTEPPVIAPPIEAVAKAFPYLEVLELIGRGGMGVVYKARQKSLGRLVALKILSPEKSTHADFEERFTREARTLAELAHPNIVTIYDFGQSAPYYFLLMEFVDGVNLRQAMNVGRLAPEQALAIVPPICEALQFAHKHGIVHRDIKPDNILLDKEGRLKIVDFGIARMMRDDRTVTSRNGDPSLSPHVETNLTQNSVLGTPSYMAPEQRSHPESVDHRADIYALGVVLFEMLTGELPSNAMNTANRKVLVDVRLDEVVMKALATKPELRWQSIGDFQHEIETATDVHRNASPNQPNSSNKTITLSLSSYAAIAVVSLYAIFWLLSIGQLLSVFPDSRVFLFLGASLAISVWIGLRWFRYLKKPGIRLRPMWAEGFGLLGAIETSNHLLSSLLVMFVIWDAGNNEQGALVTIIVGSAIALASATWYLLFGVSSPKPAKTFQSPTVPSAQLSIEHPPTARWSNWSVAVLVATLVLTLPLCAILVLCSGVLFWSRASYPTVITMANQASDPPSPMDPTSQSVVPSDLEKTYSDGEERAFVYSDGSKLVYVLYAPCPFQVEGATANHWRAFFMDERSVTLANGRSFGVSLMADKLQELRINGSVYPFDLGRLFVLEVDGTIKQVAAFQDGVQPANIEEIRQVMDKPIPEL